MTLWFAEGDGGSRSVNRSDVLRHAAVAIVLGCGNQRHEAQNLWAHRLCRLRETYSCESDSPKVRKSELFVRSWQLEFALVGFLLAQRGAPYGSRR